MSTVGEIGLSLTLRSGLAAGAREEDRRRDAEAEAAAGSPLNALHMLEQGVGEAYRAVSEALDDLRAGRRQPPAVMADMADIEPRLLWSWLSLRSAGETRRQLAGSPALARALAGLQRAADQNRSLLSTPIRKDLLLQDWLIQWSRLEE